MDYAKLKSETERILRDISNLDVSDGEIADMIVMLVKRLEAAKGE